MARFVHLHDCRVAQKYERTTTLTIQMVVEGDVCHREAEVENRGLALLLLESRPRADGWIYIFKEPKALG